MKISLRKMLNPYINKVINKVGGGWQEVSIDNGTKIDTLLRKKFGNAPFGWEGINIDGMYRLFYIERLDKFGISYKKYVEVKKEIEAIKMDNGETILYENGKRI